MLSAPRTRTRWNDPHGGPPRPCRAYYPVGRRWPGHVLGPGGWTLPKLLMLATFLGTAPWTGLCLANGLIGFTILIFCRDPVQAVCPIDGSVDPETPLPRTAIAVTVRNEDTRLVLPPLRPAPPVVALVGSSSAPTTSPPC